MTALLDSIGFGIILPVTPMLLMEITGESLASSAMYGGWLMFVFAIMQFIFMPVLGNLGDAYGRKPVLLASLAVLSVNYLIMGFAETLALLFVGRIISGIGSATFSTCNAYIADSTTPDERAQYFGMTGAAFGLGFVLGPVIGGFLGEYGSRVPFFATSAIATLNFVMALTLLPESLKTENRRKFEPARANAFSALKQLSRFKMVFVIIGVMFLYNLGHHVLPSVWSFYGMEKFDWSPREVGYSLGFIGIMMVFVQGYLIRLVVPILGLRWSGILGFSCMAMALMGYAGASASWMAYAAMVPGALGALSGPAMSGIASGQVGPDQQGELQGAVGSMMSLTAIFGPIMMTTVFSTFSGNDAVIYFPGAPFLLAAILTLMSLALFIRATVNFIEPKPEAAESV
jgi:DHA1 family tetracycline resistance protein-like MFS transporter